MNIRTIVVACWGSSCRSPMAKALIDAELRKADRNDVIIEARSLHSPAHEVATEAIDCMAAYGLDISDHVPTAVSEDDVQRAHVMLLMDAELLRCAQARWPAAQMKMYLIREYASGEIEDVDDPYHGDRAEYERAAVRLRRAARGVAQRLIEGSEAITDLPKS